MPRAIIYEYNENDIVGLEVYRTHEKSITAPNAVRRLSSEVHEKIGKFIHELCHPNDIKALQSAGFTTRDTAIIRNFLQKFDAARFDRPTLEWLNKTTDELLRDATLAHSKEHYAYAKYNPADANGHPEYEANNFSIEAQRSIKRLSYQLYQKPKNGNSGKGLFEITLSQRDNCNETDKIHLKKLLACCPNKITDKNVAKWALQSRQELTTKYFFPPGDPTEELARKCFGDTVDFSRIRGIAFHYHDKFGEFLATANEDSALAFDTRGREAKRLRTFFLFLNKIEQQTSLAAWSKERTAEQLRRAFTGSPLTSITGTPSPPMSRGASPADIPSGAGIDSSVIPAFDPQGRLIPSHADSSADFETDDEEYTPNAGIEFIKGPRTLRQATTSAAATSLQKRKARSSPDTFKRGKWVKVYFDDHPSTASGRNESAGNDTEVNWFLEKVHAAAQQEGIKGVVPTDDLDAIHYFIQAHAPIVEAILDNKKHNKIKLDQNDKPFLSRQWNQVFPPRVAFADFALPLDFSTEYSAARHPDAESTQAPEIDPALLVDEWQRQQMQYREVFGQPPAHLDQPSEPFVPPGSRGVAPHGADRRGYFL